MPHRRPHLFNLLLTILSLVVCVLQQCSACPSEFEPTLSMREISVAVSLIFD